MKMTIEAATRLEASPLRVVEALAGDPAGILTGTSSPDANSFVGEIAVHLAGGASLAQKVDIVFGRLLDDGEVARFGLSWRACEHEGLFPVFGGDLEVRPEGTGCVLRLDGHYRPPLGAVGAFGDGLIVHRLARRSLQGFLEAVAARIDASATRVPVAVSAVHRTADAPFEPEEAGSDLYLG